MRYIHSIQNFTSFLLNTFLFKGRAESGCARKPHSWPISFFLLQFSRGGVGPMPAGRTIYCCESVKREPHSWPLSFFLFTVQPWGERIPVGKDNLLLRECVIKNTDFVEGLVVYAGHESKVNSSTMSTN